MRPVALSPVISEKAVASAEQGFYLFEVPAEANKIEIAKAVAERFKVEVTDVNILIRKGKVKRFQRIVGREKDVKRAIVKLKKGQSIALFEGAK